MKEKWKEINGYDGYSVSNTGKIKSFRRRIRNAAYKYSICSFS